MDFNWTESRTGTYAFKAEAFADTFRNIEPEYLLGRNLVLDGDKLYAMRVLLHTPDYVELALAGQATVVKLHKSKFDAHLPTGEELHHCRVLASDETGGTLEFSGVTKAFTLEAREERRNYPTISDAQVALLRQFPLAVPSDDATRHDLDMPWEIMPTEWYVSNIGRRTLEISVGFSRGHGGVFDLSATAPVVIDDASQPEPKETPSPERPEPKGAKILTFKGRGAKPDSPEGAS